MSHPKPFLHRIFPKDITPEITEVWKYGPEEAEIYGGFDNHQFIDFAVPIGTPVLAAADGYLLASFEEQRIRYPGKTERSWKGQPIFWGYGLFVIMMHDNGWLTIYGHLHDLADEIKQKNIYIGPYKNESGDLTSDLFKVRTDDLGKKYPAVRVKAGLLIAYSGITGMGIGERTYENWRNHKPYAVNDEEHVHFAVSALEGLANGSAKHLDPFGIYGKLEQYPSYDEDWSRLPDSLWLE